MSGHYRASLHRKKGQAILELAIFGSMLIMLLGILINYGLRYDSQLKVMQQAFREALASAAVSANPGTPVSVTHLVVQDQYIPDASDMFAVGAVIPASSSANAIRSYILDEEPDTESEKPETQFHIDGATYTYKTADDDKLEIDKDYTQTTTVNNIASTQQNSSSVTNNDKVNYNDVINRNILFKKTHSMAVNSKVPVQNTVTRSADTTWQTPW